jgi:hypothetical protein
MKHAILLALVAILAAAQPKPPPLLAVFGGIAFSKTGTRLATGLNGPLEVDGR